MTHLRALMDEQRRLLKDKLASGTSLIPPVSYQCRTCKDTGLVRLEREMSHPMFGKLEPCPDCQSRATLQHADTSGLLPDEYGLSWDRIQTLADHDAHEAAKVVQRVLHRGYGWVYLWGSWGLGKTLILKVATARAMQRGRHAIYTKTQRLLDDFVSALQHDTFEKLYDTYVKVPVLAIDEFEKFKETEWAGLRRFHLLDDRYERATSPHQPQGVLLLASNTSPYELQDPALRDRVLDERFEIVRLTGESVRKVSKQL